MAKTKGTNSLSHIIAPKTIAIVGASQDPTKLGNTLVKRIIEGGYRGAIYPINPTAKEILGLKVYPGIQSLQRDVDLALIIVPNTKVPGVIQECADRGVKGAVIISGGFAETGSKEGIELQQKIREVVDKTSIRVLGPNINGMVNASVKLNANFDYYDTSGGSISFASQSGALGASIVQWAVPEGVGFNKFIAIGNRVDVDECEVLEYLAEDQDTKVILLYLESAADGRRLLSTAKKVTKIKPIVALKIGSTEVSNRATLAHTASLAGVDEVYDASFRQAGVIRVYGMEEMVDVGLALSLQPPARGNRVCIVTNTGGPGLIATETCERLGLKIPQMPEETSRELRKILPPIGSPRNPLDITAMGNENVHRTAIEMALRNDAFDAVLVNALPVPLFDSEMIQRVWLGHLKLARELGKPIVGSLIGATLEGRDLNRERASLRRNGLPVYPTPERAARSLKALVDYGRR